MSPFLRHLKAGAEALDPDDLADEPYILITVTSISHLSLSAGADTGLCIVSLVLSSEPHGVWGFARGFALLRGFAMIARGFARGFARGSGYGAFCAPFTAHLSSGTIV